MGPPAGSRPGRAAKIRPICRKRPLRSAKARANRASRPEKAAPRGPIWGFDPATATTIARSGGRRRGGRRKFARSRGRSGVGSWGRARREGRDHTDARTPARSRGSGGTGPQCRARSSGRIAPGSPGWASDPRTGSRMDPDEEHDPAVRWDRSARVTGPGARSPRPEAGASADQRAPISEREHPQRGGRRRSRARACEAGTTDRDRAATTRRRLLRRAEGAGSPSLR